MGFYAIDGVIPVVDASSFVHPTAVIIGDVHIGKHCYVGPGASLRGDFGRIELHDDVNVQDNCVMHSFPNKVALIKRGGHIGHGAILHGCEVGENALVGIQSVVMDGVIVGDNAFVAAMAFVKAGFNVPANNLVAGTPAKIVRELSNDEIEWKRQGTREYMELAERSLNTLREVQPLREMDADRPALKCTPSKPLHERKAD